MAARKNTPQLRADWRQKIRTSMLLNRLTDHILGKVELSASQVRGIEVLLKKTLPDLSTVEYKDESSVSDVNELTRDQILERIEAIRRAPKTERVEEKPDSVH